MQNSSVQDDLRSGMADEGGGHADVGKQIAALMATAGRIAQLQVQVWMAEVRSTASRIIMSVMLAFMALVVAIAAVAFLYAGIFHILTDYLLIPTAWALLIYAGVHALAAGVLMLIVVRTLSRRKADKKARSAQ